MNGRIILVGAGPGDPGLLTLKGRRWLQRADVVVYDYLANPQLLEHAPPAAERILVGKHGGGERVEQERIHEILIDRARLGKTVIRLKGGDPFLFGRGGEEAEAARAAEIDFEVVPGITSALAVAAYAGIPVTHRDRASNVIVTTGYEYPGKPEMTVRWEELARRGSTVVILMTQRQLEANLDRLIAAGRDPQTPAAVIEWGTRAAQRTIVGTISTLAAQARHADIRPPSLAIVGEVVQLRERLAWFERRPLAGRQIIVTRARSQASALAERLEDLGAETLLLPTIEIVPPASWSGLDDALRRPKHFDWLVFTSVSGVEAFLSRLRHLGLDLRQWHQARIAAIGSATAEALATHALQADLVPGDFRAEGLLEAFREEDVAGQHFLLPRAAGARSLLPQGLRQRGAIVEDVESYRSAAPACAPDLVLSELRATPRPILTFTSSSTVRHFLDLFPQGLPPALREARVACIGPITAETARQAGLAVDIQPREYTIPALVSAILTACQQTDPSASP